MVCGGFVEGYAGELVLWYILLSFAIIFGSPVQETEALMSFRGFVVDIDILELLKSFIQNLSSEIFILRPYMYAHRFELRDDNCQIHDLVACLVEQLPWHSVARREAENSGFVRGCFGWVEEGHVC